MRKTIIDYIPEDKYKRFNELLKIFEERKAAAPKPERKPRGPMTVEEKKKRLDAKIAKAQAELEALLAAE